MRNAESVARSRHASAKGWPRVTRPSPAREAGHLLTLMPIRRGGGRARHINAQYGTTVAICSFMVWSLTQARFPTPTKVMDRFGCSRATAYRWINALALACGISAHWETAKNPADMHAVWERVLAKQRRH